MGGGTLLGSVVVVPCVRSAVKGGHIIQNQAGYMTAAGAEGRQRSSEFMGANHSAAYDDQRVPSEVRQCRGIGHRQEWGSVDDHVVIDNLGVIQESPHRVRPKQLRGVRRDLACGEDIEPGRVDLLEKLPMAGLSAEDMGKPRRSLEAESSCNLGTPEIAIDEQNTLACVNKRLGQPDRRLSLALTRE